MIKYKHLFFDLDRTIYDFDNNAKDTFFEIYINFKLKELGVEDFKDFYYKYTQHNNKLWDLYRKGEIEKELLSYKRFALTLNDFNIDDIVLAKKIAHEYITKSPLKKKIFPHVRETLDFIKDKFRMHIITNGFEEVQMIKLQNTDLMKYFEHIITSERAGVKKPEKGIFEYSLKIANAEAKESLMIGDDLEVDILGAKNAGIDQVFVNYHNHQHKEKITFEIDSFNKLKDILFCE